MSARPPQPRRRTQRTSIDLTQVLNDPAQLSKLEFTRPETQEERQVRLRTQTINAWFDVVKNFVIVTFVIVGVATILWYCMTIMWSVTAGVDEKRWAQTILGSAVTAGLGYLIGRRD